MHHNVPGWAWIVFACVFGVLLTVDLLAHRFGRRESRSRTLFWSLLLIGAGLGFGAFVWAITDARTAEEYFGVYVLEKSLSLDNLFVFLLVFTSLKIPERHQRTGLSWGIFGALTFRAILIFAGVRIVERWAWTEYVFAAFLFYAAWHAFREDPLAQKENRIIKWLSKRLPVSEKTDTSKFVVRESGVRKATPVLVAVVAIECSDFIFAVDSVTVALSLTRNEFLIYTANAFAILGLRALYMLLAKTIAGLRYLHYGLAAILAFAGLKMVLGEQVDVPPLVSVGIVAACMGISAWFSVRRGAPADSERAA